MSVYLIFPLLFLAGAVAGGMNAVAGGGTFVTFTALVAMGVPPLIANASNAVAVFPASFASGWAYRRDFVNFEGVPLWAMLTASILGGGAGALLLILTPEHTFNALIPWLLLAATTVFAFGPKVAPRLKQFIHIGPVTLLVAQFVIATYGGYFGAAIGIMMLAVWSLFGLSNLNAMNASKTILAGFINGVAMLFFVGNGLVAWPETIAVLMGALAGGYWGAALARRANPKHVRAVIITISVALTIIFFARAY